ncbi:MAG: putative toxin-antitoxin system toxin component, PIN family [Candidatus Woesearchaeota archaeon]
MNLVLDANILFAALIKNSTTTKLLFNSNLKLYTSKFIFEEFEKYKSLILRKTKKSEKELELILDILKEIIYIVSIDEYFEYIERAKDISPDPKDMDYIALALKLNCSIWSNDKELKNQNFVKIYSTKDILDILQNISK